MHHTVFIFRWQECMEDRLATKHGDMEEGMEEGKLDGMEDRLSTLLGSLDAKLDGIAKDVKRLHTLVMPHCEQERLECG